MTARRVVALVTAVLVAGLAVTFAVAGWEQVDGIAAMASALATVGALGAGLWAALPRARPGDQVTGTTSTTPWVRLAPHLPEVALAVASLTVAVLIVGSGRWPTTILAWPAIVAGLVTLFFSVPLLWIRGLRRCTGWRAEGLFAAALTTSLLGAAFVGRGSAGVLHPTYVPPGGKLTTRDAPRHAKIPLKAGYQIDLDSTAPDWDVVKTEAYPDGHIESDLAVGLDSITATHKAQSAKSTSPTYDACRRATAYDYSIEADDEDASTANACFRTGRGRVAAVQVTKVIRGSLGYFDEVELAVTVW